MSLNDEETTILNLTEEEVLKIKDSGYMVIAVPGHTYKVKFPKNVSVFTNDVGYCNVVTAESEEELPAERNPNTFYAVVEPSAQSEGGEV